MPIGAFPKKSEAGRIITDSQHTRFTKDINESEPKIDMACARNIKMINDEQFENFFNETLEKSRDNSNYDVKVDAKKGQISFRCSNNGKDEESDGEENVDNEEKISNNDGPDKSNGNPDDGNNGPDDDDNSLPGETDEERRRRMLKKIALIAGVSAAGAIAAPFAVAGALGAAGFGSAGVVGGSIAAAWQASIGNVAAGSIFAACQSAGAAGLGSASIAASAAGGGGICAGIGAGISRFFNKGNNNNNNNNKPNNIGESIDVTSMMVDKITVRAESCDENPKHK